MALGHGVGGLLATLSTKSSSVRSHLAAVSSTSLRWLSTAAADPRRSEPREVMEYDVCIVGAGPAGLSAAIKLKQLAKQQEREVSVCVVEKGSEIGAHILSGNVFEPRALDELFPDWREEEGVPVTVPVQRDRFYLMTEQRALRLPTPPQMKNKGNYVISLSKFVRWLGGKAEEAGVDVFPGFAASEVLYGPRGAVRGIATNDFGVGKDGGLKDSFTRGVELSARATLMAEGARGSLSQEVMKRFGLRDGACPQTYALGLKEVWQLDRSASKAAAALPPGSVLHTVGWPLPQRVYGGGWLYTMEDDMVSLGYVVALDYENPYLNPYLEFQRYKSHPLVARLLEGATPLQYGARVLNEGGLQSVPRLTFPGGALLGCAAGFLNVPKIKGTHTAMKSGMMAAEAAMAALTSAPETAPASSSRPLDLGSYQQAYEDSWVHEELHRERNIRPSFSVFGGLYGGVAYSAVEAYLLRGKEPWTFRHRRADHEALLPASEFEPIAYPKPDGKLTFDLATSLYRSGTNHEHDQPPHLVLRNPGVPEAVNLKLYEGPEARYCPAGVYEYVQRDDTNDISSSGGGGGDKAGAKRQQLQINAQNCLHCKACDVKDPRQNIRWTVPEGGGGPTYTVM